MGMYNGPYFFEYVGAFIRWLVLILFSKEKRKQKGLFNQILTGNTSLAKRSAETFIVNFVIGLIIISLVVVGYITYK